MSHFPVMAPTFVFMRNPHLGKYPYPTGGYSPDKKPFKRKLSLLGFILRAIRLGYKYHKASKAPVTNKRPIEEPKKQREGLTYADLEKITTIEHRSIYLNQRYPQYSIYTMTERLNQGQNNK